jgi:hypothetical protein
VIPIDTVVADTNGVGAVVAVQLDFCADRHVVVGGGVGGVVWRVVLM